MKSKKRGRKTPAGVSAVRKADREMQRVVKLWKVGLIDREERDSLLTTVRTEILGLPDKDYRIDEPE